MTTIGMTAEDITSAQAGEAHGGRCSADPVAHAMRHALDRPVYVQHPVHACAAHAWHMGLIALPDMVRDVLTAFAEGQPVQPFTFTIARDAN